MNIPSIDFFLITNLLALVPMVMLESLFHLFPRMKEERLFLFLTLEITWIMKKLIILLFQIIRIQTRFWLPLLLLLLNLLLLFLIWAYMPSEVLQPEQDFIR